VAITAGLGEVFTIGIGQSAQIAEEDMAITFNEVIGDSRCPQNVNCVWEGIASSHVTIRDCRKKPVQKMISYSGYAGFSKTHLVHFSITLSGHINLVFPGSLTPFWPCSCR